MQPVIGFAGMTHLGLVSGICAAEKGFTVIGFDPDSARTSALSRGELPVSEPQLPELLQKNRERLRFTRTPPRYPAVTWSMLPRMCRPTI